MTCIEKIGRPVIAGDLDRQGWGVLPRFLTFNQGDIVSGMYGDTPVSRS